MLKEIIIFFIIFLVILLIPTATIIVIKQTSNPFLKSGDYMKYGVVLSILNVDNRYTYKFKDYLDVNVKSFNNILVKRNNTSVFSIYDEKIIKIFFILKNNTVLGSIVRHPLFGLVELSKSGGGMVNELFSPTGGFVTLYNVGGKIMVNASEILPSSVIISKHIMGYPIYSSGDIDYGECENAFVLVHSHITIIIDDYDISNYENATSIGNNKLKDIFNFINFTTGLSMDLRELSNLYGKHVFQIDLGLALLSTSIVLKPYIPFYIGVGLPYAVLVTLILGVFYILIRRRNRWHGS